MHPKLLAHKQSLYARAAHRQAELTLATHMLLGAPPTEAQWADVLDFFCVEWVDAEGYTEVQRAVQEGQLPVETLAWSEKVQTALWVVDGWVGEQVCLRDLATEQEVAVFAAGLQSQLPRRMVLRARVIPFEGQWYFSGEPELAGEMGVIARLELLRQWQEGPEPLLLTRMRELRKIYQQLREERDAWIAFFGKDEVLFSGPEEMEARLAGLVSHLFNVWPFPSLGHQSRAAARKAIKGDTPEIVQFQLGGVLAKPGRHGAIYDATEGIHFLPFYGEFQDHLRGAAHHPEIFQEYLEDPSISALPFVRNGHVQSGKSPAPRWQPAVLPGMDDQ